MDNIVGTKNPDYTKLPEFKKQWAKNFDMDVFRLENAMADGNTAAQKRDPGLAQQRTSGGTQAQDEEPRRTGRKGTAAR
jgi:hypothetical protein